MTNETTQERGAVGGGELLSASWLGTRYGVEPRRIEAMRRGGEIVGVRGGRGEYLFPTWQFDDRLEPLPMMPRVIAAARARGIPEHRLYEVLTMRVGLSGGDDRRLADLVREGREEQVLAAISSASP